MRLRCNGAAGWVARRRLRGGAESTSPGHLVPTVFHHKDPYGEVVMREIFLSGPVALGVGLAGEVAATGEPTNISGIPTDQMKASVRPEYQSYFDSFATSSILVVPIRDEGTVIGTLGLSREAPYTKLDQELPIKT